MRSLFVILNIFVFLLALSTPAAVSQNNKVASQTVGQRPSEVNSYSPHLPPRAHIYHRISRVVFLFAIGWRILGLLLLLWLGVSARFRDIAHSIASQLYRRIRPSDSRSTTDAADFVSIAVFFILYSVWIAAWSMPVAFIELIIERKFGFSNQSNLLFLKDHVTSLCVGWSMIPVVWLGFKVHAMYPKRWWLILWAALTPIVLAVTIVYPVVIAPLYNRYTPLEPGQLRADILTLAARADIHTDHVFVEDTSRRTSHVNAYVTGFGPSTRIVLNDTALTTLPSDQILAMTAHEMGHYAEHHVLIGTALSILGSGLALFLVSVIVPPFVACCGPKYRLRDPGDIAALPLIMLVIVVLGLLGEPVSNAVSREMEHRADAYGIQISGLNDATARLMVGFAERDLSDPDPPPLLHFWFGTHPTLNERIQFAIKSKSPRK